ncbi:MAG TPA: hypothetical protein PLE74_03325 [Candidatus Cloacimonadota bacterium]|nr:hypothetical protein [Candidatus Cloacimonadota bacterium]HPT71292.1 hypothetical protein [Candidatus Cloacimonadota bacterium]
MNNEINQRYAVIDLGTNTLKLLIAERIERHWNYLLDTAFQCRLGEGLRENGRIMPPALDRTLDAIRNAVSLCREYHVNIIYPMATEAFRLAENGEEVRDRIKNELNLDFHIITGDEEAQLAIEMLKHEYPGNLDNFMIIDIGGGSAEISAKFEVRSAKCENEKAKCEFSRSLPLGCVVLKEEFLHSDPPTDTEIDNLKKFIQGKISDLQSCSTELTCIGIGGTVVTIGSLHQGYLDKAKLHGTQLTYAEIEGISHKLNRLTTPERKELPGMILGREDILPAGAMVLLEIMKHFHMDRITIITRGIRHGVLQKELRIKS